MFAVNVIEEQLHGAYCGNVSRSHQSISDYHRPTLNLTIGAFFVVAGINILTEGIDSIETLHKFLQCMFFFQNIGIVVGPVEVLHLGVDSDHHLKIRSDAQVGSNIVNHAASEFTSS